MKLKWLAAWKGTAATCITESDAQGGNMQSWIQFRTGNGQACSEAAYLKSNGDFRALPDNAIIVRPNG